MDKTSTPLTNNITFQVNTHEYNEFVKKSMFPTWNELIEDEINLDNDNNFKFPLIKSTYGKEEIISMINTLISNKLTMGKNVELFEKEFKICEFEIL